MNHADLMTCSPVLCGYDYDTDSFGCKILIIMFGDSCNFNCIYCFTKHNQHTNKLQLNDYYSLLEQAAASGVQTVVVISEREPFLTKEFVNILDFIHEKGMICCVFTNGSVFGDDDLAERIYNCTSLQLAERIVLLNVSIILKFDSLNVDIQNLLAGNEKAYTCIETAFEILTRAGFNRKIDKSNSTRLAFQCVLTKHNFREAPEIYIKALKNNIDFRAINYYFMNHNSSNQLELMLNRKELLETIDSIDSTRQKMFVPGTEINFPVEHQFLASCNQPRIQLLITRDGTAYPCCGMINSGDKEIKMSSALGNIRKMKLPQLIEKRNTFLNKLDELKRKCSSPHCPCYFYQELVTS